MGPERDGTEETASDSWKGLSGLSMACAASGKTKNIPLPPGGDAIEEEELELWDRSCPSLSSSSPAVKPGVEGRRFPAA